MIGQNAALLCSPGFAKWWGGYDEAEQVSKDNHYVPSLAPLRDDGLKTPVTSANGVWEGKQSLMLIGAGTCWKV